MELKMNDDDEWQKLYQAIDEVIDGHQAGDIIQALATHLALEANRVELSASRICEALTEEMTKDASDWTDPDA